MARTLGNHIVEASEGNDIVTETPNTDRLNPERGVHRGLATILLDSAVGLAVQSTSDQGLGSTNLELKISLLRPLITRHRSDLR